MYLVKIGNRIYNFGLLVEADFTPAKDGVDDEEKPYSIPAKLNICFAAPESEARTTYDGDYIGEEVSLYNRILYGEEAMRAWDILCNRQGD